MKKLKSMVEKKNKKVEREHVVVDLDRGIGATCDGRDSSSTIASGLDESGTHRKESMLNLRVAYSLLYFIAASKNELNRMEALHGEMNITLQKMRAIMQRKDSLDELSEPKDGASSCLTDVKEALGCGSRNSRPSHLKPCPYSKQETLTASESLKHDKSKQENMEGWEELKAEFEAELELLQLQQDGEGFSKYSQHHSAKIVVEYTSSFSRIDLGEVPIEVWNGVHPIELERRLHQVLECRQQERIKELEAALECAENKLREKAMEVLMWKDIASVIQHCPDSKCP